MLSAEDYAQLDKEIKERVRQEFIDAERETDPTADELELQVTGELPRLCDEVLPAGKYRIGDTVNKTLRLGLERNSDRIIFGEDVEDPKGGVFRLTQRLSTEFPKQVYNSPLAESTIMGVACGLASYGKRPVFELQFIDFIGPAWNQLVTNLSTLRWRSFGTWICPLVIYAPYGAYLPGGSLWHSQANEAALAHFPGINIAIPSTPEDAAGLLWTAMHCEDPTFVLIPKHLLWAEHESAEPVMAVPLGVARKRHSGADVTLVAWGNTVEKALEAILKINGEISVDLLDLRSIVPWDRAAIEESVRRTGRLVVVQEDSENCSVGQMIISHLIAQPEIWSELVSAPILVSKANVMIGYNPIYEYAALPDVERIVAAVTQSMSVVAGRADPGRVRNIQVAEPGPARPLTTSRPGSAPPATKGTTAPSSMQRPQTITVPIMGEGIRNAKVVALLKNPGDPVELDDPLCEVETDKAVYPIESSFAGTMGEWKTEVGATVDIGQEIGLVLSSESSWDDQLEAKAEVSADGTQQNGAGSIPVAAGVAPASAATPQSTRLLPQKKPPAIELALSPTITRRLARVVPANLQIDARWDAIRMAREAAKKEDAENAASPSVMIAWAVVRAMEKHAPFRRIMLEDDSIEEHAEFDLGVAVSLGDDRLATAVVTKANTRDWSGFVERYNETVEKTRAGRVDAVNAPIVISSLGAFGVRAAAPIVVPPSVGTL
ncbi:MAG: 2-oxo acid dehydrogenase subunit E2, partial [Verrucomicrobiota bacterium]|nr:2-oxo acid dehydrogenase subunit E2 [Verrucomicrobiota bacterium]